uniref:ABC transporter substrate-binding protein n=1 Tax=Agrobacterium fabrum TaxID=1176649 RepID=UPI003965AE70
MEPAKGGSEWIFRLRKGVQFHNGKELTPEDVIYSLNHHRGEKSASAGKGYLLSVTDILKSAPDEVTFSSTARTPTSLSLGRRTFRHYAGW